MIKSLHINEIITQENSKERERERDSYFLVNLIRCSF